MNATDTIEIAPLSQFEGSLSAFVGLLAYEDAPAARQRFEGDHWLLGLLQEARRRHTSPWSGLPAVGDLPEAELLRCVEEVERVRLGEWQLAGDRSLSILERLDAHFHPQQERQAARRGEALDRQERLARDWARRETETAAAQEEAARAHAREVLGLPAA